ncbi:hypothetical protein HanHA300_Chr03g0073261 [Helianthus annuus]|nr:hypothetical protein HanHA300_Chr03g0073261 [Helianthus annuus]
MLASIQVCLQYNSIKSFKSHIQHESQFASLTVCRKVYPYVQTQVSNALK